MGANLATPLRSCRFLPPVPPQSPQPPRPTLPLGATPAMQPSWRGTAAHCSTPGGKLQRIASPEDRRGFAAAALPRKSVSSNVQLLRASFTFSVHQLFPASTWGGEKGALELYPVLTWWPPGPHLTTSSLSATRSVLPYQAKLSLQLAKGKRRD